MSAQELREEFAEEFARCALGSTPKETSQKRAALIRERLTEGTADYEYFRLLQHTNDASDPTLDAGERAAALVEAQRALDALKQCKRGHERLDECTSRVALIKYDLSPDKKAGARDLASSLGVRFQDAQDPSVMALTDTPGGKQPAHPSLRGESGDPDTVVREALRDLKSNGLDSRFREQAYARVVSILGDGYGKFDRDQVLLLARATPPGSPILVGMCVHILTAKSAPGRKSAKPSLGDVYRTRLTIAQMKELRQKHKDVVNDEEYILAIAEKIIRHGAEPNPTGAALLQVMDNLWTMVKDLPPKYAALRRAVLFNLVRETRATTGAVPIEPFLEFLRSLAEMEDSRNDSKLNTRQYASLIAIEAPRVHRAFAEECLAELFAQDSIAFEKVLPLWNENKLRKIQNIARHQAGLPCSEPIDTETVDSVLMDFAPHNKKLFGPQETVRLDVDVKNVKTLIVKVFFINTYEWYRANSRRVDFDITVDGMVPNHETTLEYSEPPVRKVRRTIELPDLPTRGVFVVDLIGNGMSSRAVVEKGHLRIVEKRVGSAGHVFQVLDEEGKAVTGPVDVELSGHVYHPDYHNEVTIPFTSASGGRALLATVGDFTDFRFFEHKSENFSLECSFDVDRESLVAGHMASVIVRPILTINGQRASLATFSDPVLKITSEDSSNVKTDKDVRPFPVVDGEESVHKFYVPENMRSLTFALTLGTLTSSPVTYAINSDSSSPCDIFLRETVEGHSIHILGRNGEPLPGAKVDIKLAHRYLSGNTNESYCTDAAGVVRLGHLDCFESLSVQTFGSHRVFSLLSYRTAVKFPRKVVVCEGSDAVFPLYSQPGLGLLPKFSLVRCSAIDGDVCIEDFSANIKSDGEAGLTRCSGLPAGEYMLHMVEGGRPVHICVVKGTVSGNLVTTARRVQSVDDKTPLNVKGITTNGDRIAIRVTGHTRHTRVHAWVTKFVPSTDILTLTDAHAPSAAVDYETEGPGNRYSDGCRRIGDEMRYVLDRKFLPSQTGCMLPRPSLLINPVALRSTEADAEKLEVGEEVGMARCKMMMSPNAPMMKKKAKAKKRGGYSSTESLDPSLDFLDAPADVFANLRVNENGLVEVDGTAILGGGQLVRVVATDGDRSCVHVAPVSFGAGTQLDLRTRDRRQVELSPAEHYMEKESITAVQAGHATEVTDASGKGMSVFDSVARCYQLVSTLNPGAGLDRFDFITRWHVLSTKDKSKFLSKHACFELYLYVYFKDPAAFTELVRPHLANKIPDQRQFLDQYMLGEDLGAYLSLPHFSRLNALEKALLAGRVGADDAASIIAHLADLSGAPSAGHVKRIFQTALQSEAMSEPEPVMVEAAFCDVMAPPPPGGPAERSVGGGRRRLMARKMDTPVSESEEEESDDDEMGEGMFSDASSRSGSDDDDGILRDADRFASNHRRTFYKPVGKTQELAETGYLEVKPGASTSQLVEPSVFWLALARHQANSAQDPFVSEHFGLAALSGSLAEMMGCLAVLGVEANPRTYTVTRGDNGCHVVTATSPMVLFGKSRQRVEPDTEGAGILVAQNFFDPQDRYVQDSHGRREKFVVGEFIRRRRYGCQVTLTNVSCGVKHVDMIRFIPAGSMPLDAPTLASDNQRFMLDPYSTKVIDFHFYFPETGTYECYPVHVGEAGRLIGYVDRLPPLQVVAHASKVDMTSWKQMSQLASPAEVLAFMRSAESVTRQCSPLSLISWRLNDAGFFGECLSLLRGRHVFHTELWKYAFMHGDHEAITEYIGMADRLRRGVGPKISTSTLTLTSEQTGAFHYLEYAPLVNARAHQVSKRRKILNMSLREQYGRLMRSLGHSNTLEHQEILQWAVYLLKQDRFEEAASTFAALPPSSDVARLAQTRYLEAYFGTLRGDLDAALAVAREFTSYPNDRWRELFNTLHDYLSECRGDVGGALQKAGPGVAEHEASLEFEIVDNNVTIHSENLKSCRVRYYPLEIESLFSTNPFLFVESGAASGGMFANIMPALTQEVPLDPTGVTSIPQQSAQSSMQNYMLEVSAAGIVRRRPHCTSSLRVTILGNSGCLRVCDDGGKPLARVYVKVYADTGDAASPFYKDGYTDLRGKFDYTSLSNNLLERTRRFAILVISSDHGAQVRETRPPAV